MTSILKLFGEETRRALIEGDDYLIVEMQVMAKAEKIRGVDSASVEYQSMCLSDNRSPWMKKRIGLLADICEETVMNFDTAIRDKVFALLQRQDGSAICLYRISVWMSLDDDGTPVWTVLDSIEPGFARINQRDVSYDTEEARQRAKSIMEEEIGWMDVSPALLSHESTEHYTPQYVLDAVITWMGAIDLDPCNNSREIPNVSAARHYIVQDNGLIQPWVGRIFLNPSFGAGVGRWFSKLYQVRSAGRTKEAVVLLWKSATETTAWKTLTWLSCRVCFPSARIRFMGPAGENGPEPPFSPALVYVGERPERFEEGFAGIGAVWVVPG